MKAKEWMRILTHIRIRAGADMHAVDDDAYGMGRNDT